MPTRITEAEMAAVIQTILKRKPKQTATFAQLRDEIPKHVKLSRADRAPSLTRPGEELWMQQARNIISHKNENFTVVSGGVKLQWRHGPKPRAHRKAHGAPAHAYAHAA